MEKGTRVGCILSADEDEVKFLGYGEYIGEEVPPENVGGMGPIIHKMGRENPAIQLDNGDKVYGCECWWGPESKVKDAIENRKITEVNINEHR